MDYHSCGVHVTCHDLISVNNCTSTICTSGCFCSNGNVLDGGYCIDPDLCPGIDITAKPLFVLYLYKYKENFVILKSIRS